MQATKKWGPPFETTWRHLIDGTIDSLVGAFYKKKQHIQKYKSTVRIVCCHELPSERKTRIWGCFQNWNVFCTCFSKDPTAMSGWWPSYRVEGARHPCMVDTRERREVVSRTMGAGEESDSWMEKKGRVGWKVERSPEVGIRVWKLKRLCLMSFIVSTYCQDNNPHV